MCYMGIPVSWWSNQMVCIQGQSELPEWWTAEVTGIHQTQLVESWRRGFQNSTPIKRAGDATPLPVTCLPQQGWFFQMTLMFVVPMCMWHCHRMNLSGYIMLTSAEYISQLNNQWQVRLGQQWYKKVISSRPLVIPSPLFLAGYKVLFIWKPVRMLMQWCRARTRIWSNLQTKPRPIKKHGHIIQYPNCILRSEIVKYVIYVFASSGEWLFPWGHLEAQRWKWQCPFGGI